MILLDKSTLAQFVCQSFSSWICGTQKIEKKIHKNEEYKICMIPYHSCGGLPFTHSTASCHSIVLSCTRFFSKPIFSTAIIRTSYILPAIILQSITHMIRIWSIILQVLLFFCRHPIKHKMFSLSYAASDSDTIFFLFQCPPESIQCFLCLIKHQVLDSTMKL